MRVARHATYVLTKAWHALHADGDTEQSTGLHTNTNAHEILSSIHRTFVLHDIVIHMFKRGDELGKSPRRAVRCTLHVHMQEVDVHKNDMKWICPILPQKNMSTKQCSVFFPVGSDTWHVGEREVCMESACLTCFILLSSEYLSCPNMFPTNAPILIPLCLACLTENMASLLCGRTLGNRSNSARVDDVVIDMVEGLNVHYQWEVFTDGSLLLCYASSQRTSSADAEEAHDLRWVSGMISKKE